MRRVLTVLARFPLVAADTAVLFGCALHGTLAAARVAGPGDSVEAVAWLLAAFAAALLVAGLLLRTSWASTAHALVYLLLAAGAVQWLLGPRLGDLVLAAQGMAFLLAMLALAPPVRKAASRPEVGEATAVPAGRMHS